MESQEEKRKNDTLEDQVKNSIGDFYFKILEAVEQYLERERPSQELKNYMEKLNELTDKMVNLGHRAATIYDELYDGKYSYDFIAKNKDKFIEFANLNSKLREVMKEASFEYTKISPYMEKLEDKLVNYIKKQKIAKKDASAKIMISIDELIESLHEKSIDYMKSHFKEFAAPLLWYYTLHLTSTKLEALIYTGLVSSDSRKQFARYSIPKAEIIGNIMSKYGSFDNVIKTAEALLNGEANDTLNRLKEHVMKITSLNDIEIAKKESRELSSKVESLLNDLKVVKEVYSHEESYYVKYKLIKKLEIVLDTVQELNKIIYRKESELFEQEFIKQTPPNFRDAIIRLKEKDGWKFDDKYTIISPDKITAIVITPNDVYDGMLSKYFRNVKYIDAKIMVELNGMRDFNKNQKLYNYLLELSKKFNVSVHRDKQDPKWFVFRGTIPLEYYKRNMYATYALVKTEQEEYKYIIDDIYKLFKMLGNPKEIGLSDYGVLVLDYGELKVLTAPQN